MNRCLNILAAGLCISFSGCAVVPFPHASADAYQFSGIVLDRISRRAVPDATVALAGLPATTTRSDANGHFVTRTSRTIHLLGIYTYDGLSAQFPPPKSASGPLRISHPRYKTRDIFVQSGRRYKPFAPRPAPIELGSIYVEPTTR